MAKINGAVMINGEKRWIRANTEQEYCDKLLKLTGANQQEPKHKHPFPKYALNWFETYSKPNIETVTSITYQRQIKKYLIPAFEGMTVEDITTDEVLCTPELPRMPNSRATTHAPRVGSVGGTGNKMIITQR